MVIYKQDHNDSTVIYTLVLSTTLTIKAQISRQQNKEGKTLYNLESTILEGLHSPKGKPINHSDLTKDLRLFYKTKDIQNLHAAIPFLCSITTRHHTNDSQPPTRPNLVERFKQRLKNLTLLRIDCPELQPTI